jgi:tRNA dimethylallyltransferase
MNNLLVILGPTATGKSDLAVEIAKKYNGEVISADSRQVYKGLDIGSGKITKKEMCGVKHYMLDVISPKSVFSVAQFKKKTEKIIADIHKRGKLPILCGGTGFYISTVVDGLTFPDVKANNVLRNKLEKQTTEKLFETLKKLDPERARLWGWRTKSGT